MERSQANLQIVNASAVKNASNLEFKFSVLNNNDDTARMVRVIVLLPVNVRVSDVFVEEKKTGLKGYEKTGGNCKDCEKCEVYWNASIVVGRAGGNTRIYYDSTVSIDLAYLNVNETANIRVITSPPDSPDKIELAFGAFVYGSLPDPDPRSNYKTAICV